jgi:hypothetical protein
MPPLLILGYIIRGGAPLGNGGLGSIRLLLSKKFLLILTYAFNDK